MYHLLGELPCLRFWTVGQNRVGRLRVALKSTVSSSAGGERYGLSVFLLFSRVADRRPICFCSSDQKKGHPTGGQRLVILALFRLNQGCQTLVLWKPFDVVSRLGKTITSVSPSG